MPEMHPCRFPAVLSRCVPALAVAAWLGVLSGCSALPSDEPPASARKETVIALTEDGSLIRLRAGAPRQVERRVPVSGLAPGETLVGIDFRVARGVLYGVSSQGRVVTIDTASGAARPVGAAAPVALQGRRFGVDFNPVADRIRVVSDTGQNLRLHPDTGAVAATDPPLAGADGAAAPMIAGAGYTYNKQNDKLTTNYAIDIGRGWLVTQGSIEGREPVVSPNTGRLFDVGALGTGALEDASFDIADIDNAARAALRQNGRTRLYAIDLATGRATLLGTVAGGGALRGIAIEP